MEAWGPKPEPKDREVWQQEESLEQDPPKVRRQGPLQVQEILQGPPARQQPEPAWQAS